MHVNAQGCVQIGVHMPMFFMCVCMHIGVQGSLPNCVDLEMDVCKDGVVHVCMYVEVYANGYTRLCTQVCKRVEFHMYSCMCMACICTQECEGMLMHVHVCAHTLVCIDGMGWSSSREIFIIFSLCSPSLFPPLPHVLNFPFPTLPYLHLRFIFYLFFFCLLPVSTGMM